MFWGGFAPPEQMMAEWDSLVPEKTSAVGYIRASSVASRLIEAVGKIQIEGWLINGPHRRAVCSIVGGANLLQKEVLDVPFGDKVADSLPWEASHMSSATHNAGCQSPVCAALLCSEERS